MIHILYSQQMFKIDFLDLNPLDHVYGDGWKPSLTNKVKYTRWIADVLDIVICKRMTSCTQRCNLKTRVVKCININGM